MTNDNLLCHIMKVINNYINSSICYMILVRLTIQVALNRKLKRHQFKLLFYQQNQINYTVSKRKKKRFHKHVILDFWTCITLVLWYSGMILILYQCLVFIFKCKYLGFNYRLIPTCSWNVVHRNLMILTKLLAVFTNSNNFLLSSEARILNYRMVTWYRFVTKHIYQLRIWVGCSIFFIFCAIWNWLLYSNFDYLPKQGCLLL